MLSYTAPFRCYHAGTTLWGNRPFPDPREQITVCLATIGAFGPITSLTHTRSLRQLNLRLIRKLNRLERKKGLKKLSVHHGFFLIPENVNIL
jgi:hypothetical protein